MKYRNRSMEARLARLIEAFPVVVVCGARQVGKSTLLKYALPEWPSVVFDPVSDIGNARQDPDLFLDNHPPPLILDEIQYAPELVPAIKRRVDASRAPGQYVLTGSQQWSGIKSASESLAGRAFFLDLEGFSLAELSAALSEASWLERYLNDPAAFLAKPLGRLPLPRPIYEQLWRGFLPQAHFLATDLIADFYNSYLRTYIERDVRLLADMQDWQQFGRFVRLVAALSSQEVNYSQIGRDIGVTPQTAQRWLGILKSTYQWFEVPAYHGNTVKRISAKPKGYIADTGLACALQMISAPVALGGHPLVGALFESAVVAEIRKLSGAIATPPAFYHWRTHAGAEVDLLLERNGRLFPMEIKLTTKPGRSATKGITAFRDTYPHLNIAPGLVICPCEKMQRLNDADYSLPWDCL